MMDVRVYIFHPLWLLRRCISAFIISDVKFWREPHLAIICVDTVVFPTVHVCMKERMWYCWCEYDKLKRNKIKLSTKMMKILFLFYPLVLLPEVWLVDATERGKHSIFIPSHHGLLGCSFTLRYYRCFRLFLITYAILSE